MASLGERSVHGPDVSLANNQDLVLFTVEAALALRRQANDLSKQRKNPFFKTLDAALTNVLCRLEEDSTSLNQKGILQLLRILERLAKWPARTSNDPSKPTRSRTDYPSIHLAIETDAKIARSCIRGLGETKGSREYESNHFDESRKDVIKKLEMFARIKPVPRGPQLSGVAKALSRSSPPNRSKHIAADLDRLYAILEQVCKCSGDPGNSEFMANIALETHDAGSDERKWINIDSFFGHQCMASNVDGCEWKRAEIQILLGGVQCAYIRQDDWLPNDNQPCDLKPFSNFCEIPQSDGQIRSSLRAFGTDLWDKGPKLVSTGQRMSLKASSVCLSQVLASAAITRDDVQRKYLLSYLLTKMVWQFYESDWISEDWSSHEVHFMRLQAQGEVLLTYRPFLSVRFMDNKSRQHTNTIPPPHRFPMILTLGISLLEIELGERIENVHRNYPSSLDNGIRANARYQTAWHYVTSKEWQGRKGTFKAIRDAIEICLDPSSDELGTDPSQLRQNLLDKIVVPLGKLFHIMWNHSADDFDIGPMNFQFSKDPHDHCCPSPFTVGGQDSSEGLPTRPAPHLDPLPESPVPTASDHDPVRSTKTDARSYFENIKTVHPNDYKPVIDWFEELGNLRITHGIGRGRSKRLKIAILDSGIDMEQARIRDHGWRIKGRKSFISDDSTTEDKCGHGTHISGIILENTNNVDLYIAKFIDTQRDNDTPAEQIRENLAKALYYVRTEWQVNMVSLSFGYDMSVDDGPVLQEINNCLKDNIVVFASASNDGGFRPRTNPGGYHQVICIHATTGLGNASIYNPSPETGKHKDNFSTVGECITSSWPIKDGTSYDGLKHMSGTSFATPVAVSVAAFMLGYIERKMPSCTWSIEPCSPEGMARIFRLMSHRRDQYDYISPGWYFNRYSPEKIREDLIDKLKRHTS